MMKTSTAMLVVACLAIAFCPRVAAAQDPYYTEFGPSGTPPGPEYWPDACYHPPCVWGSAEFLLGFRKSRQLPPLVTTNPAGTPLADVGALDSPTTSILFGGGGMDDNPSAGVRAEVGVWLDGDAQTGIGASFMGLQQDSVGFSATSDGTEILARPIFNTRFDQEGAQLVAYPGLVRGTVAVHGENEIYGGEVFLRKQLGLWTLRHPFLFGLGGTPFLLVPGTQVTTILENSGGGFGGVSRCDFLVGYQFSRINDYLRVSNNLVSLDPAFLGQIGTTLDAFDSFYARNEFHGITLGLKHVAYYGPWSLTMLGKVGLGNMQQTVFIDGRTVVTVPGGPSATRDGGLLAQPSNMGVYERDRFAVVPEARIAINCNLTRRLSAGIGYSFIYWDQVALAGDQVNPRVDMTQTLPDPSFAFHEGDTFVHAVTFLVQWNN